MKCPHCGEIMNWREPACPVCGGKNPQASRGRSRKKRQRRRRRLALASGVLVLLLLIALIPLLSRCGKDSETKAPTPSAPAESQQAPADTGSGSAGSQSGILPPQDTQPGETSAPPVGSAPQVADPASCAEFAASKECAAILAENAVNGSGVPQSYALVDLNGTPVLLVMAGGSSEFCDTAVFSMDYTLCGFISSYSRVVYDPQEGALAFQESRPMGSLENGGYSGGHDYYQVNTTGHTLIRLYGLCVDEGVPLKTLDEGNEEITLEFWQAAMDRLLSPDWQTLNH